jgi:hypothetical protein
LNHKQHILGAYGSYTLKLEKLSLRAGLRLEQTKSIVEMADADGAYTMFEDMGMFDHAECVSMLYFE